MCMPQSWAHDNFLASRQHVGARKNAKNENFVVPIISLSRQFSLINCRKERERTIFCKNFEISYFHKNKNICCPQLLIYMQLLTGGLTCDLYQSVAHLSRVQQTNTSLFIYILTKRLRPVFVLPLFRNQIFTHSYRTHTGRDWVTKNFVTKQKLPSFEDNFYKILIFIPCLMFFTASART